MKNEIKVGNKIGKLTILGEVPIDLRPIRKCRFAYVVCDCGNKSVANVERLRTGEKKSCGCYLSGCKKRIRARNAWKGMISRCTNPKNKSYKNYGGRGIKVCKRWLESSDNFIADMGLPEEKLQIDRIDNNGNYEPKNCRWTTAFINSQNRRNTIFATIKGETASVSVHARNLGISTSAVYARIKKGMTPEKAISETISKKHYLKSSKLRGGK